MLAARWPLYTLADDAAILDLLTEALSGMPIERSTSQLCSRWHAKSGLPLVTCARSSLTALSRPAHAQLLGVERLPLLSLLETDFKERLHILGIEYTLLLNIKIWWHPRHQKGDLMPLSGRA